MASSAPRRRRRKNPAIKRRRRRRNSTRKGGTRVTARRAYRPNRRRRRRRPTKRRRSAAIRRRRRPVKRRRAARRRNPLFRTGFKPLDRALAILDEVDAALDESNIDRFATMLREYVENSQFLIITHSKRTIGMASVLYGITMQEKGVSKKVSVRIEDAVQMTN